MAAGIGDHHVKIAALDDRFRFLFTPREYYGKYIHAYMCPILSGSGENRLAILINPRGADMDTSRLILADISGNFLKEAILPDPGCKLDHSLYCLKDQPENVFVTNETGSIDVFDSELNLVETISVHKNYFSFWYWSTRLDADLDGNLERFGNTGSRRLPTIFRNDFTYPVRLEFTATREPVYFSGIRKSSEGVQVFIQQGEQYYLFAYGMNPWFFLKYPFYLTIFLIFIGVIQVSLYLQRLFIRQRINAEKRIAGLQLSVLNNQIDPHFTFNAISTISASILNQRPGEANRNLLSLAWLMRSCVGHSDTLSRSLGKELTFVEHYLNLMHSKMESGFEYSLDIAPEVELSWQVPKMMIQIYAENAIKHGLRPKGEGGKLTIAVRPSLFAVRPAEPPSYHGTTAPLHHFATSLPRYFAISIEDNGIGRKQARLAGTSGTGHGMEIMEQFYATFNRFNKQKIRCEITDLEDEAGNALGTRVEIRIPVGMRYEI